MHRLGQTKPVTVYRILAEDTLESSTTGLQGLKESVFSQLIPSKSKKKAECASSSAASEQTRTLDACEIGPGREGGKAVEEEPFGASLWRSLIMSYAPQGNGGISGRVEASKSHPRTVDDFGLTDFGYENMDLEEMLHKTGQN